MRAVAFIGPGRMELRQVPDPQPGPGEMVLAVAYCGICGSDLHEYSWQGPSPRAAGLFQPIMGHEVSGIVVARGLGVDSPREGDPVVVNPTGACGLCPYCQAGLANLCVNPLATGYRQPGAYAEYVCVRADQAIRLPDAAWLAPAALTEPLAVALHILNRGQLQEGEMVFIAGGGPIGLLTLLAARRRGAGTIILSEPSPARRELARRLGADHVLDPAQGAAAQARALTGGLGCHLAVECVGTAPAMDDCLVAARRGGRVVVAGSFDQPYPLNLLNTLIQEQTIIGAFGYGPELEEAARLIVTRAVDVRPLISRVVGLEELPAVFAELAADRGRHQKVLVSPGGQGRL